MLVLAFLVMVAQSCVVFRSLGSILAVVFVVAWMRVPEEMSDSGRYQGVLADGRTGCCLTPSSPAWLVFGGTIYALPDAGGTALGSPVGWSFQ